MNPSPEDLAKSNNGENQRDWLLDPARKPREILRFMRAHPKETHTAYIAESALEIRLSEIMETYTRQLIWLNCILAFLTIGLLAVAVRDVVIPNNTLFKIEGAQATNNAHQVTPKTK